MSTRRNRTDFFGAVHLAIPGVITALTIAILHLSGLSWLAFIYFIAGIVLGTIWSKTDKTRPYKTTLPRVALNVWIAWGAIPAAAIVFPFWYAGKFCSDRGWFAAPPKEWKPKTYSVRK